LKLLYAMNFPLDKHF